jgi:hypothetical protein
MACCGLDSDGCRPHRLCRSGFRGCRPSFPTSSPKNVFRGRLVMGAGYAAWRRLCRGNLLARSPFRAPTSGDSTPRAGIRRRRITVRLPGTNIKVKQPSRHAIRSVVVAFQCDGEVKIDERCSGSHTLVQVATSLRLPKWVSCPLAIQRFQRCKFFGWLSQGRRRRQPWAE